MINREKNGVKVASIKPIICFQLHLLIQTKKANCAEFMRHFNISYTGWFNWRHQRCGNLYQGRYHAYVIDADNYLLEVSRYLHLNPVRVRKMASEAGRERWLYVQNYRWSSLPVYLEEARCDRFVENGLLLSMAGGLQGYRQFIKNVTIAGTVGERSETKFEA